MTEALHPWREKIYDRSPADDMIELGNSLCQPDGLHAGQPLVMAEFQEFIAEAFSKDINGDRVVNRLLITVPRKSGKTALIAIFLIYLLVVEPIPHAQHYSIAFDRDQAAIVFNYARNIISMSEELAGVLSVTESRKLITNVVNGSTFQSLSSEGRSKHGKSSRVVIIDELHAFGPDDELLSIMETSTGAYGNEALVIIIGTQSPDDNSVMSQWVDYAEGVNDGSIKDDSFAGFVWTAPEDADIWDEDVWYACNPGMQAGFRSIDEMRKTAQRAKELGGSKVAQFRNLYLNQRVDSSNPFITREAWLANDKAVDDELFKTAQVYGGLDLSRRGDLTALVLACLDDKQDLHLRVYCWTPENLLKQHQQSDKAPYLQWAEEGFLETTPGNSIGYDWVAHRLGEIAGEVNLVISTTIDIRLRSWKESWTGLV